MIIYSFVIFSVMMHILMFIQIINFFRAGMPFPHPTPSVGPEEDWLADRGSF